MATGELERLMNAPHPELMDIIYVEVGEVIKCVNTWTDLVKITPVEVAASQEMDCEHCAAKIFRDPETFRCTFCCCNYNRIDGKSVIFKTVE